MTSTDAPHALYPEAIRFIGEGDVSALAALLDRAPELVKARAAPPARTTLLHASSFNGVDELCFNAPPTAPAVARLLIERGAEPDALAFDADHCTPLCWTLSSWFSFAPGLQNALADAYLDGGAALEGVAGDGAPLGHAICFGYTSAVEHLVARGARHDHLHAATALGDLERLQAWRRADGSFAPAAMNFTRGSKAVTGRFSWPREKDPDPGTLALTTAATHGRIEVVRWLLDTGVDPNASTSMGQTALHFAAYVGYGHIVKLLLESGASPGPIETQFDRTPAEWALETNEPGIAEFLRSQGG